MTHGLAKSWRRDLSPAYVLCPPHAKFMQVLVQIPPRGSVYFSTYDIWQEATKTQGYHMALLTKKTGGT